MTKGNKELTPVARQANDDDDDDDDDDADKTLAKAKGATTAAAEKKTLMNRTWVERHPTNTRAKTWVAYK